MALSLGIGYQVRLHRKNLSLKGILCHLLELGVDRQHYRIARHCLLGVHHIDHLVLCVEQHLTFAILPLEVVFKRLLRARVADYIVHRIFTPADFSIGHAIDQLGPVLDRLVPLLLIDFTNLTDNMRRHVAADILADCALLDIDTRDVEAAFLDLGDRLDLDIGGKGVRIVIVEVGPLHLIPYPRNFTELLVGIGDRVVLAPMRLQVVPVFQPVNYVIRGSVFVQPQRTFEGRDGGCVTFPLIKAERRLPGQRQVVDPSFIRFLHDPDQLEHHLIGAARDEERAVDHHIPPDRVHGQRTAVPVDDLPARCLDRLGGGPSLVDHLGIHLPFNHLHLHQPQGIEQQNQDNCRTKDGKADSARFQMHGQLPFFRRRGLCPWTPPPLKRWTKRLV